MSSTHPSFAKQLLPWAARVYKLRSISNSCARDGKEEQATGWSVNMPSTATEHLLVSQLSAGMGMGQIPLLPNMFDVAGWSVNISWFWSWDFLNQQVNGLPFESLTFWLALFQQSYLCLQFCCPYLAWVFRISHSSSLQLRNIRALRKGYVSELDCGWNSMEERSERLKPAHLIFFRQ